MNVSFYRDQAGDPRAKTEPRYRLLAGYLESEIMGSLKICRALLEKVDRISDGRLKQVEETGNAFNLTLDHHRVCIEALFDDAAPACHLSLEQFRKALSGWQQFLQT